MNIGDLGCLGWRTVVGHRAVLPGVSIHFRHNIVYFMRYRVVGWDPTTIRGGSRHSRVVIVTINGDTDGVVVATLPKNLVRPGHVRKQKKTHR